MAFAFAVRASSTTIVVFGFVGALATTSPGLAVFLREFFLGTTVSGVELSLSMTASMEYFLLNFVSMSSCLCGASCKAVAELMSASKIMRVTAELQQ